MNLDSDKVIDPVCEMMVGPDENSLVYLEMPFAFCSIQCKDRFIANPHLYIGYPGEKAPKQTGKEVIKNRKIVLDSVLDSDDVTRVYKALNSLMGIQQLSVTDKHIEISYDLLQITLLQIETTLNSMGVPLDRKWIDRLRREILRESEELLLDSMEVVPHDHQH
ncbi:MAG: hypothetical protein ACC707_04070 [Thiohalomonadales bacterium]